MKTPRIILLVVFVLYTSWCFALKPKRTGFYMPDSLREVSINFSSYNNLVILPVTINDTLHVNLILDTGCRNLILFGKSFKKYFNINPDHKVQFSGLGDGKALNGCLAINNKISIGAVLGESIPVVIISDRGVFKGIDKIDGVIGYDIFIKFEIELNPSTHKIIFRPAMLTSTPDGYIKIPVHIKDSRPVLDATIHFSKDGQPCELMIDTGSSLGLLLKTTDVTRFNASGEHNTIGRGFNGFIEGYQMKANKVLLTGFELTSLNASITESPWHNYASIGMDVLKDYSIVLNYCKEYMCIKKILNPSTSFQ